MSLPRTLTHCNSLNMPVQDPARLQQAIASLRQEKEDLELMLTTAMEHGDAIQADLQKQELHQHVAYCITKVLSESKTLEEAIPQVLQLICDKLEWPVGEFWRLQVKTQQITCTATHTQPHCSAHREGVQQVTFTAREVDWQGYWLIHQAFWLTPTSSNQSGFPMATLGEAAALQTALALPIMSDRTCVGTFLFFQPECRDPDAELMELMVAFSSQIGLFIERSAAQQALKIQSELLQSELQLASQYVQSLLPPPLQGDVNIQRLFQPSHDLGGDAFDYYWLDEEHLVVYLLDVAGHGVKSALLAISALNVLRAHSLKNTDFYEPADVLAALNNAFAMGDDGSNYFTIWYGVYNRSTHKLTYSCGGHPPAILVEPNPTTYSIPKLSRAG